MRIYVLGASGFLGSCAVRYWRDRGHKVFTERAAVERPAVLHEAFHQTRPDVVLNATGAPARPSIDWCEDHKEETVRTNLSGAINVALTALEHGVYPIQIASGCVYTGDETRVFTEEDEPNYAGSFYSRMRIAMELALRDLPILIARIRIPISEDPHPRNIITKLSGYNQVISAANSVTLVEDLFPALETLSARRITGIFNLTNDRFITYDVLTELYQELVDPDYSCRMITPEMLQRSGLVVAGRSNCVLSNAKAQSCGVSMPALDRVRLTEILKKYKTKLLH